MLQINVIFLEFFDRKYGFSVFSSFFGGNYNIRKTWKNHTGSLRGNYVDFILLTPFFRRVETSIQNLTPEIFQKKWNFEKTWNFEKKWNFDKNMKLWNKNEILWKKMKLW